MEVSEQIIQVFDAICEKIGITIEWTNDNVLPYLVTLCTKLISYEIWTSVAWMAIMSVVVIVCLVINRVYRSTIKESLKEFNLLGQLVIFGHVIVWMAATAVIGTQIFDIIKCITFPEMFVFEYIQAVLNSGG